ncbi:MAG: deoxyribose-phosphate aldolase [Clostridia bacterium]|nr:deoxyribose-phosphate aldolase [Clostridia bacterium]
MNKQDILKTVDHTLLKVDATWAQIKEVIDDGIRFQTASVCIPASFVKQAAEYAAGKVKVCTVIGFPCGYSTTAVKCMEAKDAVQNGADEVDMVADIGWIKDQKWGELENEIRCIKEQCGEKVLKVIIETCLLTRDEKIKMCEIVGKAGADFIKTSTGFSTGGATREDIALFARHVPQGLKIKAAGGIRSLQDAEDFLKLGAHRLGTSAIVKIIKEDSNGQLSDTAY